MFTIILCGITTVGMTLGFLGFLVGWQIATLTDSLFLKFLAMTMANGLAMLISLNVGWHAGSRYLSRYV